MKPLTTIMSSPVAVPDHTAEFYRDGLGLQADGFEEGIVAFELPNLSIVFSATDEYGEYLALSGQEGSKDPVPGSGIISCAFATRAEIDDVIDRAVAAGRSSEPAQAGQTN